MENELIVIYSLKFLCILDGYLLIAFIIELQEKIKRSKK